MMNKPRFEAGDIVQAYIADGDYHILIEEIQIYSFMVDKILREETQYYLYTILDTGKRGIYDTNYIDQNTYSKKVA